MANSLNKCSANETAACCCVDVGTIIDNEDCKASFSCEFAVRQQAESMLATLTEKASAVESDPCQIDARIEPQDNGFVLDADFTFCCQAETLIFQLGLR
ncbi:MAG: YfcZ/YiiS family protein [Sodalis sp. (in: enterobacteria)]|uniref:YfcZ/YiiS family protein n=1 Tax=Sodalis sp. (in: enterobacteria) TaxID=1898979 RepID=UPI0039E21A7E